MSGTIYIALGVVFLALSAPFFAQSKKGESENPQTGRLAGILFTLAGAGFLIAGAIAFLGD